MSWSFVDTEESSYAPPPPGKLALLFIFRDEETGKEHSLLSYLDENYGEEDVAAEADRLRVCLDNGEL